MKSGIARGAAWLLALGLLATGAVYALRPDWLLEGEYARLRWYAGAQEKHVVAAGHRIAYDESGSGTPVLLVHGFTGAKEHWLELARWLRPGYRVLMPDLPGWNESTRMPGADYDVAAQAERLLALLDALELPRVHLVGHSMGGHIAGVFAARHPERLLSLGLMNASGVRFPPNDFARRVLAGATPFNYSDRASFHAFMRELFVSPRWLPPRVVDVLVERNRASHEFHATLLRELSQGPDADLLQRSLGGIRVPTLVFWCRGDKLLDVSSVPIIKAGLTQAPRVDELLLDDCGHMPLMEKPRESAERLAAFFKASIPHVPAPL